MKRLKMSKNDDFNKKVNCPNCKGRGRFKTNHIHGYGPPIYTPIAEERRCGICNGTGKMTLYEAMKYKNLI